MVPTPTIPIWEGCDPLLANAISTFSQTWEPYSAESRRFSIFRLFRELIDPAWSNLCAHYPELSHEALRRAWGRYKAERSSELEAPASYVLSTLANYLGFDELYLFIKVIGLNVPESDEPQSILPTIDTLRDLAMACRDKKPKRLPGKNRQLVPGRGTCRFCDNATELAASLIGKAWSDEKQDPFCPNNTILSRLSSIYCSVHKSKASFSQSVTPHYLKVKRNQAVFDRELKRLNWQSWGGVKVAAAKSGNQLVDAFIWRLSLMRRLSHEQHYDQHVMLQTKIRREARMLVDQRITDRKKEIIVLLGFGLNQSQVAERLGLTSRQAVSKALSSIPLDYRLDILWNSPVEA